MQLTTFANAFCESFMKTLKREEIYASQYQDIEDLRSNLEVFLEQYYNRQRLHSALQYCSPEQFEKQIELHSGIQSQLGATVEFTRPRTATGRHELSSARGEEKVA